MEPAHAIATIADALRDGRRVSALFLSGSHGAGLEDAYSDIDFLLVSPDGATDDGAALCREAIGRTGEIVLWINAITRDWLRIDIVILKPDQMGRQTRDGLKVLFDHDRLYDTLPASSRKAGPDPRRARYQFEEFIRILGLLPLAMGREEYLNGVLGVFHLRNLLVDLMIEETGASHRAARCI